MNDINIKVNASKVEIEPIGYKLIEVSLEGVDTDEILKQIDIEFVISYFDITNILNEIGVDEVKKHFDLIETPEF